VELALSFLSSKEKQLIYLTYFQEDKPLINIIWQQLHMSKSIYYRQKNAILDKIVSLLYRKNAGIFGDVSVLS
jgi:DNA-directed RNA polymerase specialized sigma subunit